jgi:DNA polymerase-2
MGIEIVLWLVSEEHGSVRARFRGQRAVCFALEQDVPRHAEAPKSNLRTRDGRPVVPLYFESQRSLLNERDQRRARGQEVFETDVKPADRFLMERMITAGVCLSGPASTVSGVLHFEDPEVRAADVRPKLRALSLDIETDGWDGPILSIAIAGEGIERVFVQREGEAQQSITFHPDERSTIASAFEAICAWDPDVIIGWNVVEFDLRVLEKRAALHDVPFAIGRAGENARVIRGATKKQPSIARVPGRVVLDGVATMRTATWAFERFALEDVAQSLLGRGKARRHTSDPLAEIQRMYREDPLALAAYNLEDCRLVLEIFSVAKLVEFAVERSYLTGLSLDRQGGSVAAFDHLYLPRLHRRGFVAPDVNMGLAGAPAPGGHVLESVPKLYRNVLSFDFRSLYPSIIRTYGIDPLGLYQPGERAIPGFDGAAFARESAILPELIASITEARKRAQNAKNDALQRAIKILMNSFYGVLGSPGCRFYDMRLASSITRRGHEIIERSRRFFQERGLAVLYGDTDSLFVSVSEALDEAACRDRGEQLAQAINEFWMQSLRVELDLTSHLQMRFESHYLRFLMPTMRHSGRGSKKRYAGLIRNERGELELVIRGLEAVRRDWTKLAREMQRELLWRVFNDLPWQDWLRSLRRRLEHGECDDALVYHRRLRRGVDEYESTPPHVRAAAMMVDAGEGDEVDYVITKRGPEPVGQLSARIDYDHYLEKQLAPAADVILPFLGTSFEALTSRQLRLF